VFRKLFGRGGAKDESTTTAVGGDLYVRAKAAADLIGPGAMSVAMSERGLHVESMLVALGAVAGFGCQIAARLSPPPEAVGSDQTVRWVEAQGADGRSYFLGDAGNHYLLEAPMSLWNVAAGVLPGLGAGAPPDIIEIVRHVAGTIGTEDFGSIRFPPGTGASHAPTEYLVRLWPDTRERLGRSDLAVSEWCVGFGIAVQIMLMAAREATDPVAALGILMETAVAMAKIDPAGYGLRSD
jgi:hypothetical protein